MSVHYISFFMKRVYYNDMTRALASVIFIIVNEMQYTLQEITPSNFIVETRQPDIVKITGI